MHIPVHLSQFSSMARNSISRHASSSSKALNRMTMKRIRLHLSRFWSMARKSISQCASSSSTAGEKSEPGFTYSCYPFLHINKYPSEDGNTIVPAAALDVLLSLSRFSSMAKKSGKSISRFFSKGWKKSGKSISKVLLMARKSRSRRSFSYQCYPFSPINKCHCKDCNEIIMPASAFDVLLSKKRIKCPMKNIKYPMTFTITNPFLGKLSHGGALQFTGEEGTVYLPDWMMNNLALLPGQLVSIEYAGLSRAASLKLKIQSHSTKLIIKLSDPKQAVKRILKDFGDAITVNHENIVQARPKDAQVSAANMKVKTE